MASNSADPSSAGELISFSLRIVFIIVSSTDDQDYQVQYDDEEEDDDERTIEEEEQLESDEEQNELDDLEAVRLLSLDCHSLKSFFDSIRVPICRWKNC